MQIIKISHLTKVAIKTRTSRFFHRNLSGSPDIRTEIHKKKRTTSSKNKGVFTQNKRRIERKSPCFSSYTSSQRRIPTFIQKNETTQNKNTSVCDWRPTSHPISHRSAVSRQRKSFGFFPMTRRKRSLIDDQRRSYHLPNIPWRIQDLSASNLHTVIQSVQPWSFPFISTTLCAKCSKRNSYFCPK